jgi:uncharacterized MAPEG superfamily protein
MELFAQYQTTIWVFGLTAALFLIQFIIYDIAALKAKHTPGHQVKEDHGSFLFRANRAMANSNETLALFVLISLFAMFSQTDADWVNACTLAYLAGRVGHMLFYYFNLSILRSLAFVVSFLAMLGMLGLAFYTQLFA